MNTTDFLAYLIVGGATTWCIYTIGCAIVALRLFRRERRKGESA